MRFWNRAGASLVMMLLLSSAFPHTSHAQAYYTWVYGGDVLIQSTYGGPTTEHGVQNWGCFPGWWTQGSALDFWTVACITNAEYHLWGDSNGVWGYYVSVTQPDAAAGDMSISGPVIDVNLLPEGFTNGDVLTAMQLNTAMGSADFCGSCGDVPPLPDDPPGTTSTATGLGDGGEL